MDRRRFLTGLGSTLPILHFSQNLGAQVKSHLLAGIVNNSNDEIYDCIVLGAGVAGVTVARELSSGINPRRVLVLEASQRIGGRVHTRRDIFKRQVECGAELVHIAPLHSPLWRELYRYGLHVKRRSTMNSLLYHPLISSKAIGVVPAFAEWALRSGDPFKATGIWSSLEMHGKADMSVAEFLRTRISSHDTIERDLKSMILTGASGGLKEIMSMQGFHSDHMPDQLDNMTEYYVRQGYDTVPKKIATDLNIRFGQKVAQIVHSKGLVTITTDSGEVYRARSACVTFSAGVLKSNQIEFKNGLPESKLVALDRLEMSFCSKVHIEFSKRFWPEQMTMLQRPDGGRRMGRTYFVPFTDTPTALPMLTALIMSDDGKKMDGMSDTEILQAICADLSECFPGIGPVYKWVQKKANGQPSFLITQWHKNSLAMGEASYIKYEPGASLPVDMVRKTYADPSETPGLFWAGEGTAVYEQPSSVHGAHSTGLRAFIEIDHYLQNLHNKHSDLYLPFEQLTQTYNNMYGLLEEMRWFPQFERSITPENPDASTWSDLFHTLIDK